MRNVVAAAALAWSVGGAWAIDGEHDARAREVAARAIAYLRAQQGPEGGWGHRGEGPNLPAISALVVTGMVMDPAVDEHDPAVARGVDYVLSFAREDGSIHDGVLASYNTAISVSMLSRVNRPEAGAAIVKGQGFLRGLQYDEGFAGSTDTGDFREPVARSHPYYGGVGYGRHGRPDLSNVGFFVEALHDTGVSVRDPAFERALVFLSRVQMVDGVNDQAYADGSNQGGFVYATVEDRDSIDGQVGQSQAGMVEETLTDGTVASRLRSYGSMTYVGFKSLVYADLRRDDERVVAARGWIERNFTVEENPGLGDQGRYYYYAAMARALDAWGEEEVAGRGWRAELIDALARLQEEDGSFRVVHDRWMEGDPVLITAYALVAVQTARGVE